VGLAAIVQISTGVKKFAPGLGAPPPPPPRTLVPGPRTGLKKPRPLNFRVGLEILFYRDGCEGREDEVTGILFFQFPCNQ
jgi:hypothetical protein